MSLWVLGWHVAEKVNEFLDATLALKQEVGSQNGCIFCSLSFSLINGGSEAELLLIISSLFFIINFPAERFFWNVKYYEPLSFWILICNASAVQYNFHLDLRLSKFIEHQIIRMSMIKTLMILLIITICLNICPKMSRIFVSVCSHMSRNFVSVCSHMSRIFVSVCSHMFCE